MRHPLRKAVLILIAAIMLMFFVAAVIDKPCLGLTKVISRSLVTGSNHYLVLLWLVSMWVLTIGLMCRSLKNIPGINSKRGRVEQSRSKI